MFLLYSWVFVLFPACSLFFAGLKKPKAVLLSVCLFATLCCHASGPACAASISVEQPISFGTIIIDSTNVTVEINAINAAATPRIAGGGLAHVSGGASGLVQVISDIPGQFIILTYPGSVILENGAYSMTLDGITSRSKQSAVSTSVGPIDFHVGGLLHVGGGQTSNNYSGSMTVNVTINNP